MQQPEGARALTPNAARFAWDAPSVREERSEGSLGNHLGNLGPNALPVPQPDSVTSSLASVGDA
jgi:hypothetical protein